MVIGTASYGKSEPENQEEVEGVTNVSFSDPNFYEHMKDENHNNYDNIQRFIRVMGLCHTVIVDEKDEQIKYNASSPDELALVNAARYFGFMFTGRDSDNNMIVKTSSQFDGNEQGSELKYKLLDVIEFTSSRKKMSVIVQTPDKKILVMCKGADSII